jgi:hypothetical protein
VDEPGRAGEQNTLSASKYLGAIAASAEKAIRRIRRQERHRKWEEAKKASVREMVWEYQVRRGMWVEEGVN